MKKRTFAASALSAAALLSPLVAQAQSVQLSPEEVTRRSHAAQPGDTLFDLSARYLGDALRWPTLWSFNPQITNPHWIYPGDAVFYEAPAAAAERRSMLAALQAGGGAIYPVGGFYTSEELAVVGRLEFAHGPGMLSQHDLVYLRFDDPDAVNVGDTFAINRVVDRVFDEDDNLIAVKYVATGEVQVVSKHIDSDYISAEITRGWDAIERGDVLFASRIEAPLVRPVPATVDLEARIVDQLSPTRFVHEQQLVFVNRGWRDGVEPGNRFIVWDRGDDVVGYGMSRRRSARNTDDAVEQLPWYVAGEAMVVYATEHYATAVILDAGDRELETGMRLTMQAGY